MTPERLRLGEVDIHVLRDGFLSVDRKAMFGRGPGTARSPRLSGETDDKVFISLNVFLIETEGRLILVDTGVGGSLPERLARSYGFRQDPGLSVALERLGYGAGDIDFVVNTHLHFDHCGGNTRKAGPGRFVPAFPRAIYIIQEGEWRTAQSPPRGERPNYRPETFEPIREAERLRRVDGDATVCPGIEVILSPGHTRYHQCVKVTSKGRVFVILGDLVPTAAHVRSSAASSYDLDPAETLSGRTKIFDQGLADSWTYGFVHDSINAFGSVAKRGRGYVFRPRNG